MKIIVAIKQVPERDAQVRIDSAPPQLLDIVQLTACNLPTTIQEQ